MFQSLAQDSGCFAALPDCQDSDDPPGAICHVYGRLLSGGETSFAIHSLNIMGMIAYPRDPLRNGEKVAFAFPGYGIVMAQMTGYFGMEARFRFEQSLEEEQLAALIDSAMAIPGLPPPIPLEAEAPAPVVSRVVMRSVSCGVSPSIVPKLR